MAVFLIDTECSLRGHSGCLKSLCELNMLWVLMLHQSLPFDTTPTILTLKAKKKSWAYC